MEENQNNIPQENTPNNVISNLTPSDIQQAKEVVESIKETVQSTSGTSKLMGIIFFLILVVVGLGSYILVKEGYFTEKKNVNTIEEEEVEKPKETEKEPELEIFEGEYISAEIPQEWSVKEYKNGENNGFVPEGNQYTGLTTLEVNHESKNIFKLEILDGVGSIGCPQIVLFKDSPENFEEKQNESNEEIGLQAEVLDYTNTTYSEITLFGTKIRRVGTKVFFDTDSNTVAFEAQCENNWIEISGLNSVSPVSYFRIVISQDATQEELTVLDSILESMKLVK